MVRVERPNGCLEPVQVDDVVADPDHIRDLACAHGPYFMPARYLVTGQPADTAADGTFRTNADVPPGLVGPTWRGDWAVGGHALIDDASAMLDHQRFIEAAHHMFDAEVVVPEHVYVNLSTPMPGQGFSHVDIAEFVGVDRTNAPGWLLQAMGSSGLFEDARISIATAVAWFHTGERGFFRYWPKGRGADSIRHENMWNTAVVGDNDFMHHQVERIGPAGARPPTGLTIDTTLDHVEGAWSVIEAGATLAEYTDDEVRLSLSWKARVYADDATRVAAETGDGLTVAEAVRVLAAELDAPSPTGVADALADTGFRSALAARWSGYRSD